MNLIKSIVQRYAERPDGLEFGVMVQDERPVSSHVHICMELSKDSEFLRELAVLLRASRRLSDDFSIIDFGEVWFIIIKDRLIRVDRLRKSKLD